MRFKTFLEAKDIFGFGDDRAKQTPDDDMMARPIMQFNLEWMRDLLLMKSVGGHEPFSRFVNEIQWGDQPGAVKLEIDPGLTFYVKKLGKDKEGSPRWVTKKMFQLNRQGYGGLEDAVAHEIHEHIQNAYHSNLEAPREGFTPEELENLVLYVYEKIKKTMKEFFVPLGIKKIQEYAYIISMEVAGGGVEAPDHRRVEQNQTMFTYDKHQGTIRIFNYNIESPVGRRHEWTLMENDLDVYFFPTQDRDEIAECLSVHFKYY
jgi:hypothetical protein